MIGSEIKPGEIVIKDVNILIGLMERRFSPLLVLIISAVAKEFGLVMTESFRNKRHPNDLHGVQPVRAIDLRTWCYVPDSKAYEIMQWINRQWIYDPARPDKKVAIIHRVGNGALHFHIQVHPNTRRRSYS